MHWPYPILPANEETDLATRAAWLSYVGGYNQGEIAERLGVSRIKVHRLISTAHRQGLVKVRIEHGLTALVELEEALVSQYGLDTCTVVPLLESHSPQASAPANLTALGMAGAGFLKRQLATTEPLTIGIGWGRTLAAVAQQLQREHYPQHRFVSLIGSLTRHCAASPYDMIHRLVDLTGAEGYYLPVPCIADTLADKEVLLAQQSVQTVLALAREADVCLIGIGQCSEEAFFRSADLITPAELVALQSAGVEGDMAGTFIDQAGKPVACEVNSRSLGVPLAVLHGRRVVAIAGGQEKDTAILAALRSGVLTGLITDEGVARRLLVAATPALAVPEISSEHL